MFERRFCFLFFLASLLLVPGCHVDEGSGDSTEQAKKPIVGGSTESGWQSVGALTVMHPAYGYMGSFCSATLIEPQWVLTAGHCLENDMGGSITLTPGIVRFYVGSDANNPSPGSLYEVDAFYIHPDYDDDPIQNDIALVHLKEPLGGVTPVSINTTSMGGSWIGQALFYVGFGVNNGDTQTGGGVKRSGWIEVEAVYATRYYSSAYNGVGVCYGDSGGPGLREMGGSWYAVGVNSATGGGSEDPCLGYGIHTRVDAYSSWVSNITGGQAPDCNDDPNMCYCADACLANGTCDNSLCEVLSCAQINICMSECPEGDDGCYVDCYLQGTSEGRAQFDAITQCGIDNGCYDGGDYQTCMSNNCQSEIDACFEPGTGTATCEELYGCLVDCPAGDQICGWGCYESGSAEGQQNYDSMAQCFEDNCSGITDEDLWTDCVYSHCAVEIEGCFVPANCNILGGECSGATACWPTPGGNTDCYNSDGVGLGQSCDPNLTDRLSCGDGMMCSAVEGNVCVQFCYDESHCQTEETCNIPAIQNMDDLGYCFLDEEECIGPDCGDASVPDGGGITDDGGTNNNQDGGIDENDGGGGSSGTSGGGCGCSVAAGRPVPTLMFFIMLMLGLALPLSRRR